MRKVVPCDGAPTCKLTPVSSAATALASSVRNASSARNSSLTTAGETATRPVRNASSVSSITSARAATPLSPTVPALPLSVCAARNTLASRSASAGRCSIAHSPCSITASCSSASAAKVCISSA